MSETSTFALAGRRPARGDVGRVRRAAGRMLHGIAGRRGGARARTHGRARRRGGGSERRHGCTCCGGTGSGACAGASPSRRWTPRRARFGVYWPAAMACAEGAVDAQVMVTCDGEAISTLPFVVRVTQALTGTGEGGGDGYSLFLEAIEKFEGADALISDAVAKAQQAADVAAEALEDAQGASSATAAATAAASAANAAKEELLAAAARGGLRRSAGRPGRAWKERNGWRGRCSGRGRHRRREPDRQGGANRDGRGRHRDRRCGHHHGNTQRSTVGDKGGRRREGPTRETRSPTPTSPPSSWRRSRARRETPAKTAPTGSTARTGLPVPTDRMARTA